MVTTVMDAPLLDSALRYAESGWRVFPVALDKRPLTPHGFQDASTHEGIIRQWFERWPHANIALDIPEGIVVLDFDPRNGAPGPSAFQGFLATLVATTPSGGYHCYFRATGSFVGQWMPGIDVKAGGKGYVLLPPSQNAQGITYKWMGPDTNLADRIRDLPQWVRNAISKPETSLDVSTVDAPLAEPTFAWDLGTRYGTYALEQQLGFLAMAREGERNRRLNRVGYRIGQLAAAGEVKEEGLHEVARVAEMLGLDRHEVLVTLKSSFAAGIKDPWRTKGPKK